ncbi:MAG: hypothetical protein AVDCRST_MAG35-2922 [uncultured Quadrisphaera sp.]|uniref:Uncharacterized protein n=1 Tax=uncultured Quadrisphaera sp. TaxID=904978 RepID=A0A6J4Q884_9ACTN|nr:MAG: hypothetical protein AVDCRST_MAG35-2922 [uncultured Quadrisphaera sp.]
MLDRAPWPVVPGAVLFWLFFLGGNLLLPQTVALAWLLTSLFAEQHDAALPARPARRADGAGRRRTGPPPVRRRAEGRTA